MFAQNWFCGRIVGIVKTSNPSISINTFMHGKSNHNSVFFVLHLLPRSIIIIINEKQSPFIKYDSRVTGIYHFFVFFFTRKKQTQNAFVFALCAIRVPNRCVVLVNFSGKSLPYGVATGLIGPVLKSILHSSPSPLHNRICCERSSLFFILPRIRRIRGSIHPFWE